MNKYDSLLLKNQLCFPLYAVSNKIIRKYKPLLDDLDLTYTQYITMMVLWERKVVNERELCDTLKLQSNTVTPLLQRLKQKGFITIDKSLNDKRNLVISLTEEGLKLKDKAINVPPSIAVEFNLTNDEVMFLYSVLYKILDYEKDGE